MKFSTLSFIAVTAVVIYSLTQCNSNSSSKKETLDDPKKIVNDEKYLLDRGKYLVATIGCNDCHSPKIFGPQGPMPDPERILSGHPSTDTLPKVNKEELKNWVLFNQIGTATVGPWGISYASNLTSDETGIGNWSEEQFFKAMREGKYKGLDNTRPLLPPMPWPNFKNLNDEDLRAIFKYLKSTKPVKNIVPAPKAPSEL